MTNRSSLIVLLLLLGAGLALGQIMNGTYTVKTDGTGDFLTPLAAQQALSSRGARGTVTIDIYPGTYNLGGSQISLSNMPGAYIPNDTATIIFKAQDPNNKPVINFSGFYGNLTSRVKILNLILNCTSYGFQWYGCQKWKVEGCVINSGSSYGFYKYYYTSSPYYNCDDDSIIRCEIKGGSLSAAIYSYGYSTAQPAKRAYYVGNIMSGWSSYAISSNYEDSTKMYYNTMYGSGSYALYGYYHTNDFLVNNIMVAGSYPIYRSTGCSNFPLVSNYNCFRRFGQTGGQQMFYNPPSATRPWPSGAPTPATSVT